PAGQSRPPVPPGGRLHGDRRDRRGRGGAARGAGEAGSIRGAPDGRGPAVRGGKAAVASAALGRYRDVSFNSILSLLAAATGVLVAAAVLVRDRHSASARLFAAGMAWLSLEELLAALAGPAGASEAAAAAARRTMAVGAFAPALWL